LPAEGTDGQIQLHLVVELTVAAEYFHPAIFENIPGGADTGSEPQPKLMGLS